MNYLIALIVLVCFVVLSFYVNNQLHKNLENYDLYKKIHEYHKETYNIFKPSYWYKNLVKNNNDNCNNGNDNDNKKKLDDFVKKVYDVSSQRSLNPELQYSYKISDSVGMNNNRCVLYFDNLYYTGIIKFIIKNIGFNEKCLDYTNKILKKHKINELIIGIDANIDAYKVYYSFEDSYLKIGKDRFFHGNCIEMCKDKIKYKYYESVNINLVFDESINSIFKNKLSKERCDFIKSLVNTEKRKSGCLRYEITENDDKIGLYGMDIPIFNKIINIKKKLITLFDILNDFNNSHLNKLSYIKWLNDNYDKYVNWLGINYRKEKLDFCLYYN